MIAFFTVSGLRSLGSAQIGGWASGEALSCEITYGATNQSAGMEVNPRYGGSSGRQGLTNAFGFRSLAAWAQPVAALTAGTQEFRVNRDETWICR